MQQPTSLPAPGFGANPACTGNSTEQDPNSQLGGTADLCAAAEGAAAGSWTATPAIGVGAATSGIIATGVVSKGGLDILALNIAHLHVTAMVTGCVPLCMDFSHEEVLEWFVLLEGRYMHA